MSKRAAIPELRTGNVELDRFAETVKQNMDDITGQNKNVAVLKPLPATATLFDLITEHNKVVTRLQG